MAHRFIIDDQTGQLYKDFTGRRLTSAAEILKSERGLTPTLEFYLIKVATDTGAVTAQTLTNAQLSVAIGSASTPPDSGFIKASFTQSGTLYESEQLNIESLTAASLESAFNSSIQPVYNVGGLTVDQIGPGKWLLTMKKVGAITGSPSLNVENSDPPSGVEVTSVTTGDSDTRAQWIISLSQLPVATIAGGSFSAVTSGSFSGLSSSIALNTTGMLAAIARNIKLFEFSVIHNNQVLHRSTVEINESLDPTAAGTVVVTSPSLFTLGSNAVNQGETIALSGGLTYDGTTLAAPFLPLAGGTMTGDALFGQDVKAVFGSTLEIYYDGSHSRIREIGTGELRLQGTNLRLFSAGGENYLTATENGAVSLFYDAVKKFETTSLGATISGKLIVNGDLDVSGTTTTFNSSVVTVDDPVFTVGGDTAPVASDNKDRGIEFRYMRSGESAKVGFFGYSNADDAFKLLTSATNNSEVFSGTLADLKCGKVLLEDGSASAPSYTFNNDSDTGFYSLGGGAIGVSFNANQRWHWTADFFRAGATLGAEISSQAGSASLPNYRFRDDNNTGIFRADADTLAFTTGGTEAARFDSSGNLGINGTANHKLTVFDTNYRIASFERTSGTNGYIIFKDQNTTQDVGIGATTNDLKFRSGNVDHMVLNSSGKLGIGVTPSVKLHVSNGASGFSGSYNSRTQAIIESDNSAGTALSILNPSSGNGAIYFGDNLEEYSGQISYYHTGDVMKFATGATVRMNLNSTGLGIGVTPSARLEITTASQGDTALQVGYTTSTPNLIVGTSTGSTKLEIANGNYHHKFYSRNASGTAVERLAIEGGSDTADIKIINSNLGIGGTPDKTFHIKTTAINTAFARIESTANNSYPTLSLKNDAREYQLTAHGGVSDSFVIYDGTVGANRFLIDTSGNVGIGGVTSPSAKLEISDFVSGEFGALRLSNTNTGVGDNVALEFKAAGLGSPAQIVGIAPGGLDVDLAFLTVDSNTRAEVMRITGNGNVGIGTSGVVIDQQLHVKGDAIRLEESVGSRHLDIIPAVSGSSHRFTSDSTGSGYQFENNVGTLVSFTSTLSQFNQDVKIASANLQLNSGQYVQWGGSHYRIEGSNGNWLKFWTANTERMRIDSSGNVGISTTSPSANADLTLGGGELCMAETTTPTADANFGKIYCKSDNKLYFQDGAGTEHEIAFV